MIANYHTHTARCHHARGTDREYIEAALQSGLKILGFSDHTPFTFYDGSQDGYRVRVEEGKEYCDTIKGLREEYAGRIELHVGFEMEHYPLYFKDMLRIAQNAGAEYLILGEHFIRCRYPDRVSSRAGTDDRSLLDAYVEEVTDGMRTGMYSYVAHPEVFNFTGSEEVFCEAMRPICTLAREMDLPLEINFLGIRGHRDYPREYFWKMVGEEHAPVIFGCDAHEPESVGDRTSLAVAESWVKKYGLKLRETLELRPIK